jgi:hypothetical protein
MKRFSPNLNNMYLALTNIDLLGQVCKFVKIQDGGGRHLEFRKMLIVFRKYEAILTEFEHHTPGTNQYQSLLQFCFQKQGGVRHLKFRNMLYR